MCSVSGRASSPTSTLSVSSLLHRGAVSLGHGISLISERGYLRSLNKKDRRPWEDAITFRPLKEDWCCRMCGIAHLSERYLPQAVREFYQFLVASFPA